MTLKHLSCGIILGLGLLVPGGFCRAATFTATYEISVTIPPLPQSAFPPDTVKPVDHDLRWQTTTEKVLRDGLEVTLRTTVLK